MIAQTWQDRLEAIERDCKVKGWNSYNAAPVKDAVIAKARALCESLDVVPTTNGGIEIVMAAEGVSLELDPDGNVRSSWFQVEDINGWPVVGWMK